MLGMFNKAGKRINKDCEVKYSKGAQIFFNTYHSNEAIFFLVGLVFGWFNVYCKDGLNCGSQLERYLFYSTYTVIPIFILIFVIYSLYNLFKPKK